ncbi:MAG: carbonic anhydrase [Halobacteriota archaeon]
MQQPVVELFRENTAHSEQFHSRFDAVQDAQHPEVVTICCSDSRVLQDHIFGNDEPGRIFTCANIGNRVLTRTQSRDVVSGDVLYPVEHTGTKAVVVVGHTGCGAVTATYDDVTDGLSEPAGIERCLELLRSRIEPGITTLPSGLDRTEVINRLVEYNVDRQVDALVESDDVAADVDAIGVVYDFQDVYSGRRGEVHLINVNGETSVDVLGETYPELESRIERLWEY